jgi:hypothetical protein
MQFLQQFKAFEKNYFLGVQGVKNDPFEKNHG